MKLDIGTLAGLVYRGDRIVRRLQGGDVPQTIGRLKTLINDPEAAGKLLGDLEALGQHLRVLRMADVAVEDDS